MQRQSGCERGSEHTRSVFFFALTHTLTLFFIFAV
jgi:hypothetical protein